MMRSQNVQALDRIFLDSRLICPSGSQFLKDLDMDMKVDLIWLPIDRVALLLNKNLKTIRRMVDAGKLTALKHQIPTKNGATIKTFVLATEEIIQAEYDRFRDSLRKPEMYFEETIDLGARALFNSPPMLEAPPKDSDEIIEEMTRKMMMRLPKHPDMLSQEQREQLDPKEKERLAEQERDRIILKEIKESFDRIGLEYQPGNDKPAMEFAIGFSQTAREYYKAQQRAQAEQEVSVQAETAPTTTDGASIEGEDNDPAQSIIHTEEWPDDKQAQVEAKNGQSPFAHLSRAELLKRIGIN